MKDLNEKLRIFSLLSGFCNSVELCAEHLGTQKDGYYLLEFYYEDNMISITTFSEEDGEEAAMTYSKKERYKTEDSDVLLVKAASINDLQTAYPNYFSNITYFLSLMEELTQIQR